MGRCAGITAAGSRCKAEAMPQEEWCWNHHPDYEQARRRRASKGGRRGGCPQRETEGIKVLLEDLTERVLSGDLDTGRAAVANQLVNTRLRATEQERKIKEKEELESRIEALEQAQERGGTLAGSLDGRSVRRLEGRVLERPGPPVRETSPGVYE